MTVKLVMNSVIANTFQALAEGLGLARAAGLSDSQFFAALDLNVAKSGVADLKKAKLEQGDFAPQFSVKHLYKDLVLALRLAGATDAGMPQTEHLLAAYAERLAAGDGDLDFSVLIKAAGKR
jgi:3-hydroxyisobutyrate dehydrogenase-like beta-hydroxyacid dehydrogenase